MYYALKSLLIIVILLPEIFGLFAVRTSIRRSPQSIWVRDFKVIFIALVILTVSRLAVYFLTLL
jgi:hypothetical protein